MTTPAPLLAIAAALALPDATEVPEWVHLFPAGTVETYDGRGPFDLSDLDGVIQESLTHKARLVIDENHSTDLAAKQGLPAPARGYIVEMQARADGIWARIDWNAAGRALLADRSYWGISPVFQHDGNGRVLRILRAALTNDPALRGLTALSSAETEAPMGDMKKVAKALGLAEDASEEAILAAIAKMKDKPETAAAAEALAEIGRVFGVEGGEAKAILAAAKVVNATRGGAEEVQTELAAVKAELEGLKAAAQKAASEAFIDQALRDGRSGVNQGARDELVALHMDAPSVVEKLIGFQPKMITAGGITRVAPPERASQAPQDPIEIASMAAAYQKRRAADGFVVDIAAAVEAVMEGKQ